VLEQHRAGFLIRRGGRHDSSSTDLLCTGLGFTSSSTRSEIPPKSTATPRAGSRPCRVEQAKRLEWRWPGAPPARARPASRRLPSASPATHQRRLATALPRAKSCAAPPSPADPRRRASSPTRSGSRQAEIKSESSRHPKRTNAAARREGFRQLIAGPHPRARSGGRRRGGDFKASSSSSTSDFRWPRASRRRNRGLVQERAAMAQTAPPGGPEQPAPGCLLRIRESPRVQRERRQFAAQLCGDALTPPTHRASRNSTLGCASPAIPAAAGQPRQLSGIAARTPAAPAACPRGQRSISARGAGRDSNHIVRCESRKRAPRPCGRRGQPSCVPRRLILATYLHDGSPDQGECPAMRARPESPRASTPGTSRWSRRRWGQSTLAPAAPGVSARILVLGA